MDKYIVGTRKSKLAIKQTKQLIESLHVIDNAVFQLHEVETFGDANQHIPLYQFRERGIFTNEIDQALADGTIDLAIHSLKDLHIEEGADSLFIIAATSQREDVRDVFISRDNRKLSELQRGAVIGTSSLRRRAQLLNAYPFVTPKSIRGPINERIEQLFRGDYDGIILAAAGIHRLQMQAYITEYLPIDQFTPAAGQGALVIQCRRDDRKLQALINKINNPTIQLATTIEREFIAQIDAENNGPVGVYAYEDGKMFQLTVRIVSLDGKDVIHFTLANESKDALVKEAVQMAKERGAKHVIHAATLEI